jgi:hypothetical protein
MSEGAAYKKDIRLNGRFTSKLKAWLKYMNRNRNAREIKNYRKFSFVENTQCPPGFAKTLITMPEVTVNIY